MSPSPALTQTRPGLLELLVDQLHLLQAALDLLDAATGRGRRREAPREGVSLGGNHHFGGKSSLWDGI